MKKRKSTRKIPARRREAPRWLVVVDPGGKMGWAVFENGRLIACGHGKHEVLVVAFPCRRYRRGVGLVEIPVAYPAPRSEVDPNSLIRTAVRGGEFKQLFRELGLDVEEVEPKRWKGNTPKPERVSEPYLVTERVIERLDDEELAVLYQSKSARATCLDHNCIDAVGMGLWRLGRWI